MSRNAAFVAGSREPEDVGGRIDGTMAPARSCPGNDGDSQGHTGVGAGGNLNGWKAVAGHLGRDIRTVQRWELSEGLPVHRLGHKQRATAYAYAA